MNDRFAEVAVNSPISRGSATFHYALPAFPVSVGQLVWVPFGKRQLQGVVLALLGDTTVEGIKEIAAVIDPRPVLTAAQVGLARWISSRYACSLFDAVRLMLPPGAERHLVTTLRLAPNVVAPNLPGQQQTLVALLKREGTLRIEQVRAAIKARTLAKTVDELVRSGAVIREFRLHGRTVKPKYEKYVELISTSPPISQEWIDGVSSGVGKSGDSPRVEDGGEKPRRRDLQAAVLAMLRRRGGRVAQGEVYKETGCNAATLAALARQGLIAILEQEVRRDPLAHRRFPSHSAPSLTSYQEAAWRAIVASLGGPEPRIFLLHGVTGSGKTELYLRAIERTIASGKRTIVMVPEIALTPQTVHRFASRFPGAVAVLHSKLSVGEHYDEWRRVRDGEAAVVVGSRSALFAPLDPLGLIVIDEEHEWSYKQDQTPRYHAREVAIELAALTGAQVILGSATPDVVSYYHAQRKAYTLLELPERVLSGEPAGGGTPAPPLPPVRVIDMRQELRAGNRGIFSRALCDAITVALAAREQVILFLNRRGSSTFVMCRDCGFVMRCRRCDLSMVYHGDADELICHCCNYRIFVPETCPDCWSGRIKYFGAGTQRVEEEASKLYPEARLLRWDRDVTGGKHSHEEILRRFSAHEADILIGTQMIAKGLDIPLVTLVGIVSADTALHLPDLRAGERSFQLLTQVAGRAGRGALGGKVILQTYSPEHYCVQAASRHDYGGFYRQEIAFRRERAYPPFSRFVRLLHSSASDASSHKAADRLCETLRQKVLREGLAATSVIGPAPAYHRRLRGKFRWQILVRGPNPEAALQEVSIPPGWRVDVDPMSLL